MEEDLLEAVTGCEGWKRQNTLPSDVLGSSVASSGLDHRSKKKGDENVIVCSAEIEEGDWFLFRYLTLLSVIPAQPDRSGVKQAGSKKNKHSNVPVYRSPERPMRKTKSGETTLNI